MRRGFMGMMLKPKCNCCNGWGRVSSIKKSTDELVKDQGDVGFVFWLERHCPSWICITWSDGKQTVLPGSSSTFEGCCAQEEAWIMGKPYLHVDRNNAPAHASLFIRSYLAKHQTSIVPQPPYSPDLAPADFFLFPNLKPLWKGIVSKPQRRFRKMW